MLDDIAGRKSFECGELLSAKLMKPLHIALVRQRYSAFGGAERFMNITMQALKQRGVQFTLLTRRWENNSDNQVLICDPFYIGNLWRDCGFAHAVHDAEKNGTFDLVQSHERLECDIYRAGDGVHRVWLEQRALISGPLKKITTLLNPHHRFLLNAEKKMFLSPRLKAVICNSEMVKREIQQHFGLDEKKLHVIYNAVDNKVFNTNLKSHRPAIRKQYGIPDSATVFLFVGSGFERKGLSALLHAMNKEDLNSYAIIVGKDKHEAKFKQLANELGIDKRVIFAGSQKDVRPFYGTADVFVLPTLYDPFPNATLEAFACGLPVVTSTKSGAAELITNGKSGFVCDPLDVDALRGFIKKLSKPGYAVSLSQAAAETVKDLTTENMSKQLYELYTSLIDKTAGSPPTRG
jgi:UDP-glucose:(heptosyl)LPS alpha-1,3-glucosyltransferase